MTFETFVSQAWRDHANNAEQVAGQIPVGIKLIDKNEQIFPMARLITHVFGEHLGEWQKGIELNQSLRKLPVFKTGSDSELAINRFVAALEKADGKNITFDKLSPGDKITALTVAASALSGQKQIENAQVLFKQALNLAVQGISKTDPANRALAIAGNNMASSLEGKDSRTAQETELMILAAETGRKFWEIVGTFLEVERAEYRLAMSYLKAKDFAKAIHHAQQCIKISKSNNAEPLELFFGYEALAQVEKAQGHQKEFSEALEQTNGYFEKLSDDDKSWCEDSLKKLL